MAKYSSKEYSEIFWKLPKDIQNVITSYSTTEHLRIIGQKHSLHIDKIGELVDTTFDVMMGVVSTRDFVKELSGVLEISALDASVLARDVDENVLKPIKKLMVDLYANGAPYKPSSSLVQFYEEDEEHLKTKKEDILRGIEDPEEAVVRKETVTTTSKVVGLQGGKSNPANPTSSQANQLPEIYHEEIENEPVNKVVTPQGDNANQKPNILVDQQVTKTNSSDFLNKIAGMKLSNTLVMPKNLDEGSESMVQSASKLVNELGGGQTNTPANKIAGLEGDVANSGSPHNKEDLQTSDLPSKIDPYREQI